jgi:hypothetical protein
MAMRIAAVEGMTRFYLLQVLDVDDEEEERVEAIIGELPFRRLRAVLLAAVRDGAWGDIKGLEILKTLMRRVARLEERRNILTHSSWNYSRLPAEMIREKRHVASTGRIRSDTEVFGDLSTLDALVTELDEVAGQLSKWYLGHYLGVQRSGS